MFKKLAIVGLMVMLGLLGWTPSAGASPAGSGWTACATTTAFDSVGGSGTMGIWNGNSTYQFAIEVQNLNYVLGVTAGITFAGQAEQDAVLLPRQTHVFYSSTTFPTVQSSFQAHYRGWHWVSISDAVGLSFTYYVLGGGCSQPAQQAVTCSIGSATFTYRYRTLLGEVEPDNYSSNVSFAFVRNYAGTSAGNSELLFTGTTDAQQFLRFGSPVKAEFSYNGQTCTAPVPAK